MGRRAGAWLACVALASCAREHLIDLPPVDPPADATPQGVPDEATADDAGTLPFTAADAGITVVPDYERTAAADADAIAVENARPGDDLRLTKPSAPGQLEGFSYEDSVEAGEAVHLAVSADAPTTFDWEVFRIGWYGGAGARKRLSGTGVAAAPQKACDVEAKTQLVDCDWPVALTFTSGSDWLSGLYVVRLTRADGLQSYVPFAVHDHRRADLVVIWPENTDEAYNGFGGESLYQDRSGTMPSGRAVKVSFNRPYTQAWGAGSVVWNEAPMARYLERLGYDVTYGTSLDLALRKGFARGTKALVLVGHDEYWTQTERDAADELVAKGGSLLNFGANNGFWRVRLESDRHGRQRIVTCYKSDQNLEPAGFNATSHFYDAGQPENALFGVGYVGWMTTAFPFVARDPKAWLFEGTNMQEGEAIYGLGYNEIDGVLDNGHTPPGLERLGLIPALTAEKGPVFAETTAYRAPAGGLVFSAGAIYWPVFLGTDAQWNDPRVERMTYNVLERALSAGRTPLPPRAAVPPQVDPFWAESVSTYAGSDRGFADGPSMTAKFDGPTALAFDPLAVALYVADTNNHRVRRIANGEVTTVAGDGTPGSADGTPGQLNRPAGLALASDGTLYIADSGNHTIRRLAPDGTLTTLAGVTRAPGRTDGPLLSARFNTPRGLDFDTAGHLVVADSLNCTLRQIDLKSGVVSTLAGNGCGDADGPPLQAQLRWPTSVFVRSTGEIFIADSGNQKIRRLGPNGVETLAGGQLGYRDGTGDVAQLRPSGGLFWASGLLFVADTGNARLRKVTPGTDAASTRVFTVAFDGRVTQADGAGDSASVMLPVGLVEGEDDVLYVADAAGSRIRRIVLGPGF